MKLENAWDFVVAYYPKYHSCNEIAENDDLQKIVDGELDGDAEEMFNKEFKKQKSIHGGMLNDSQIKEEVLKVFQARLNESNAYVYKQAIEAYIALDAEQEEPKSTHYIFGSAWVNQYNNNGIKGVIKSYYNKEDNYFTEGASFEFIEGETKSAEFVEALIGWMEYETITKEEFEQLNK